MKIIEKFNCKWTYEEYTDNNPELFYHTRIRLTCIESNNEYFPVGTVQSFAKTVNA